MLFAFVRNHYRVRLRLGRHGLHSSPRAALAPPRVPMPATGVGRRVRKGRGVRRVEPVASRIPALASVLRSGLRDVEAAVIERGETISIDLPHSLPHALPHGPGGVGETDQAGQAVQAEAQSFFLHPAPEDATKLYFTSGGAQSWRYEWDAAEACFKAEDGHDLLGMISRELLWHTTGLPKF